MTAFARTDHSIFGKWWWTVDRWTLAVLAVLMGLGIVLVQAASPARPAPAPSAPATTIPAALASSSAAR